MTTTLPETLTLAEAQAALEEAARQAAAGIRDPEAMRLACERMDRFREKLRQKHGTLTVAVDLLREVRNAP